MDVVLLHYYVSKNKIFELSFSYSERASSPTRVEKNIFNYRGQVFPLLSELF